MTVPMRPPSPQARHYISQKRIPTGEPLRLRDPRVVTLALEHQHVLAVVIGQFDDDQPRRASGDHSVIVASVGCSRRSSCKGSPILYEHYSILSSDRVADGQLVSVRNSQRRTLLMALLARPTAFLGT